MVTSLSRKKLLNTTLSKKDITASEMLERLNSYYTRERQLQLEISKLLIELENIKEDIKMIELLILFKRNREMRKNV